MKEAVDDVLALRAADPAGLNRIMTMSFAAHLAVVAAVVLVPRDWLFKEKPPTQTMTISLGGAIGAPTSGMTPAGARPVEKAVPEPKRVEAVKPVATAKPDVMTIPEKPTKATPVKPTDTPRPPSNVTQPPTTGRQVQAGTSRAETGAKGQDTGLTLGGGGTGAQITALDFCCPGYIAEMTAAITALWQKNQAERGEVTVKFTVQKDGRVTDETVEKHGTFLLDQASIRPLRGLKLKPFPAEITDTTLTFHLTFVYQ